MHCFENLVGLRGCFFKYKRRKGIVWLLEREKKDFFFLKLAERVRGSGRGGSRFRSGRFSATQKGAQNTWISVERDH